jgi:hypothetical protein
MTSISDAANIVSFFAGAGALVGVVRLLHSQSVDDLRSRLFALRDEMFLYAVDNGLLANPAYCGLRRDMNGFIRYAHKINITRVLMLSLVSSFFSVERMSTPLADWTAHLDKLNEADKRALQTFHDTQKYIVAMQFIRRSILLSTLMRIANLYLKVTHQAGRKENMARAMSDHIPWRSMENEAACA